MKKIILSIAMLTFPLIALCQTAIKEIWTKPAIFKADEEVTIFFDVTGTPLDGNAGPVYLWSWFPSEPDAGNFANSSEFAKLTKVEGNVWQIKMVPSQYYKVPAANIVALYGLLKNKDGSLVTDAFAPDKGNAITLYDFNNIGGSKLIDSYPKTIKGDRPFSIVINTNNTWSDCTTTAVQGALATAPNVHLHGGLNDWKIVVENNPANLSKTALTPLGNGIYRMDMIPWDYFGQQLPINKINAVFASSDWAKTGVDKGCADFFILNQGVVAVTASYNLFPQKITKKDILSILAVNGDLEATDLNYTVTAGAISLTGKFEGVKPNYSASIDLATALKSSDATKIHVTVKTNSGASLLDTDVALTLLTNK